MLTRALPLLLLFTTFLFINAEVWQVAGTLEGPVYAVTLALFFVLGSAFVLSRIPECHPLGQRASTTGARSASWSRARPPTASRCPPTATRGGGALDPPAGEHRAGQRVQPGDPDLVRRRDAGDCSSCCSVCSPSRRPPPRPGRSSPTCTCCAPLARRWANARAQRVAAARVGLPRCVHRHVLHGRARHRRHLPRRVRRGRRPADPPGAGRAARLPPQRRTTE